MDGEDQPNAERADDLPVRRVCETVLFREFSLGITFQMLIGVADLICLHLFETAKPGLGHRKHRLGYGLQIQMYFTKKTEIAPFGQKTFMQLTYELFHFHVISYSACSDSHSEPFHHFVRIHGDLPHVFSMFQT